MWGVCGDFLNIYALQDELGQSYTTRVFKKYVKANNIRTPVAMERMRTPTEEDIARHQRQR